MTLRNYGPIPLCSRYYFYLWLVLLGFLAVSLRTGVYDLNSRSAGRLGIPLSEPAAPGH